MPLLSEIIDSVNFEQDMLMLKDKMKAYALQYCEALAENYKQYRINMHQNSISNPPLGREDCRTYAAEQLAGIANGTEPLMKFRLSEGKKYWKVIQQNPNSEGNQTCCDSLTFCLFFESTRSSFLFSLTLFVLIYLCF